MCINEEKINNRKSRIVDRHAMVRIYTSIIDHHAIVRTHRYVVKHE